MEKLILLPRKEFEIVLEDKTIIKGRYSLWASKRYSDKLGLTLMELFEKEEKNHVTFDDIVQVVLCSVEDAFRRDKKPMPYTDQDVCDWFEWLGGIGSPDYLRLMGHAKNELGEKKSNGTIEWNDIQRICYAGGLSPEEFWDCTLDEALLVFKGKVYDWNIHRGLTTVIVNTIGGLFKMPPIRPEQLISLPFDEVEPMEEGEINEAIMTDQQLWEQWEKQNKN